MSHQPRGSTRKSHAVKLNACLWCVCQEQNIGERGRQNEAAAGWAAPGMDRRLFFRRHQMSLGNEQRKGPWQVVLAACCDPTWVPPQLSRSWRPHMHLPTFVTLQWRLKTHKKRKGLLIRTKKDKCLSACPHQLAKQSAGGFCFYSLSNASPSRHTQVLLALAGSHEEET